jgi:hypothetical protein
VFDEKVLVKHVTSIRELAEDYQQLWYQGSEYETIRSKAKLLIHKVTNKLTNGKNYCVRGLEGYFDAQGKLRTKLMSWDSVLDEQEKQFHNNSFDENRIAKAYSRTTSRNKKEAIRRASYDEEDALSYQES